MAQHTEKPAYMRAFLTLDLNQLDEDGAVLTA